MKILIEAFKDVKQQTIHDWHNRRLLVFTEGMGTLAGLLAAVLMAGFGDQIAWVYIYGVYLASSMMLFHAAIARGSSFLLLLNTGYAIINVIGIYRYF